MPQRVVEEGGYRIKGRSEQEKASFETQSFGQSWESGPVLELVARPGSRNHSPGFHPHHRYWIWG